MTSTARAEAPLTIGSLCTGYGGLDLAVQEVTGAAPSWFADNDPAAARILRHHWPNVPNLGDLTAINWDATPPVNILTAGFPCQPFAAAGRRQGHHDERHLWPYIRTAIRHLRPDYIYLENVAGLRSLGLDRVLGDMAEDGLNVEWESLRASTIGAPHHRERIFILATPPDARGQELPRGPRLRPNETTTLRRRRPSHSHNQTDNFGPYTPAIRRWEQRTTAAPPPTQRSQRGTSQLNPAFSEWMMGLPPGHITHVPGLTRAQQLNAIGNGVCPQQAAAALTTLLNRIHPPAGETPTSHPNPTTTPQHVQFPP